MRLGGRPRSDTPKFSDDLPTRRLDADLSGKQFYVGAACSRGHTVATGGTIRFTSTAGCVVCVRNRDRQRDVPRLFRDAI